MVLNADALPNPHTHTHTHTHKHKQAHKVQNVESRFATPEIDSLVFGMRVKC
jgi:hypothetical protein